jgi:hypothetical protein
MKKTAAVFAVLAAGLLGSVAVAAPASAASACVHLDININGQGQTQDICLPPA